MMRYYSCKTGWRECGKLPQDKTFSGLSRAIQTDGGAKFSRWAFMGEVYAGGYQTHPDRAGEADTDACIESLNRKFFDERLSEHCEHGFEILAGTCRNRSEAARLHNAKCQ
jgi:hypothetical protein